VKPPPFAYEAPARVSEVVDLLARHGEEAKVLAGGQSLVPMLNLRLARPAVVVDINGVAGLGGLGAGGGRLEVGALVRQRALERWSGARAPLVAEALRHLGHGAIRTRGTVVGSIVHADPAAELPAVLLCCEGSVVVRGPRGERVVPAGNLYQGPLMTSLRPDELALEARLALPDGATGWGFAEVARRHGDFALAGAVALLRRDPGGRAAHVRLALFGVGETPVRSVVAEKVLLGEEPTGTRLREAARVAAEALDPPADIHATSAYRRRAAAALAERALTAARDRAGTAA
jgi:aerobic carbon-monoxide dehydrogenase medium subunit